MATLPVRWPHDVHLLVTAELAARTGHLVGKLLHISAGDVFEMDAEEARARVDAGDVMSIIDAKKPDPKPDPKPEKAEA